MRTLMFPGQGAQHKGMGAALFDDFRTLTGRADEVLGYSIKELCVNDPDRRLAQTRYTQSALFVVSALSYLKRYEDTNELPAFVLGHSVGEYAALFAAESLDFDTALRIVAKRGELMAQASAGGMCAVIGKGLAELPDLLAESAPALDVANFNADEQVVLSGPADAFAALDALAARRQWRLVRLNVSGAFHSRYMADAAKAFAEFIAPFDLSAARIPVIANVTGKPYPADPQGMKALLVEQITHSVRWTDSIRYLRRSGARDFVELGPGSVLTGMVAKIQ